MIFRHREHKVPGLNTTSTADISFMLLIFFLVTTNMDIDKGLQRQLPPADKQESQESYVAKGTTMALTITADDQLLLDDKPFKVDKLKGRVEAFVKQVGKKHLITLNINPSSNYDTYFHVQNELVAAYSDLRNDVSMRLYGRKYDALTQTEKDKVKDECPQRIAELYQGNQANQPAQDNQADAEDNQAGEAEKSEEGGNR